MNKLLSHTRAEVTVIALCILSASVFGQDEVVRVESELVNLNVVVTDRQGRRISGLTREEFEVFEDGSRQEITHFTAEERPLKLVMVFDISVSMEAVLPTVKQEALALLSNLRVDDEVLIVTFASEVNKLSGWVNKQQAADIIRSVTAEPHPQPKPASIDRTGYRIGDSNTYLYEAFRYLFDNFKADEHRIAIVMFSDGVDTGAGRVMPNIRRRASEIGKEVLRQAQESWALIYPIRYKTEQAIGEMPAPVRRPFPAIRIGSAPSDPGRELFAQIAAASGGEVFEWATRPDLMAALRNALADLRSQYGIAYKPSRRDGRNGFRRTKVRVKRPGLVVRTREGYFHGSKSAKRAAG
jgi:Ca-activated chloride channel family protein